MTLGLVLAEGHVWRDQAEALGQVAFDGDVAGPNGLVGLARVPIDLLLLDASGMTPMDLEAIRNYRIARPGTRIVVSVPAEAKPGAPIPSGLVALGIYDLSTGTLDQALAHHATFADAVRWQTHTATAPALRERHSATARGPTLIVVAGAGYGIGTTTMARLVAETVVSHGHQAIVIDAAIMSGASCIGGRVPVTRATPTGGHLAVDAIEAEMRRLKTGFVIVDAGRFGESLGLAELVKSADLLLVAVPPATHRLGWAEAVAQDFPERKWPFLSVATVWVVVGGNETEAAAVAARLKDALGDFIPGTVRHLPLLRSETAVAAILGERLLPEGSRPGLMAQVRWQLLSMPAVAGSGVHLLGTVVRQAAYVVGRLAGLMIVAGVLALIAVVVMPVFGHVDAVAQVSAWVSSRWQALGEMLP